MVEIIYKTIKCQGLIPEGAKVVVGVSGGADSVALLRALHQLGIPVTIAHLNHQLRGAESDGDERFVRELADGLGIPVTVKSIDVRQLAEGSGVSIEMAARQARHDFFHLVASGLKPQASQPLIALAHHADDQVETFILKLARGAGSEGLGGMSFSQTLGNLRIIRPMLEIPRTKIIEWLKKSGFEWREDASNADEAYLRNRVRHTVLPMLESELNPNLRETILRTMDILRAENEWMKLEIRNLKLEPGIPLAARRRLLREWLFEQGVEELGFEAGEKILALMDRGEGSTLFELNDRLRVVVEYGKLRFEDAGKAFHPAQAWKLSIESGSGWKRDHGKGAGILPAEASFDADKVGRSPITVRNFEPGDRINPLGMEGSRKLQDIFTDQKIPRAQRTAVPVVICRGEIIWLPGYRTARGWEVQADGRSVHARIELNEGPSMD